MQACVLGNMGIIGCTSKVIVPIVTTQSKKKKKKGLRSDFFSSHVPHLTPLPIILNHSFSHYPFSLLAGSFTSLLSFLFFSFSHTLLSALVFSTGTSTPPPPPFPPSFSSKITRNFWEPINTFTSFF